MSGALLVAGTTSDAGKSVLTAGICRWLARQGVRVAPFKAQNMSLNSWVTADGAEIGRAQVMQAAAAGVEPEGAMNPVLLKPGAGHRSQVVLRGRPVAEAGALDYRALKGRLFTEVLASLADLRSRFDVVICEGAGSPAEINLRADDIANMGLARAARLPTLVVGDIDRGGVFAAMFGTLALLEPADQALVAGFVVNKFRGERALLEPGLGMLSGLTGRPVLGVLPWRDGLGLDVEDSLGLPGPGETRGDLDGTLRVAAVRLPFLSNFTDLDALAAEPGVAVRYVDRPEDLDAADLVVLPGTRSTVADLAWLRGRRLDGPLARRAATGRPVLGVCGGYQMLAETIVDEVESGAGRVDGLGLLPVTIRFAAAKTLGRPDGVAYGQPVRGYEIHHGVASVHGGEPFLDGCRAGAVWGTTWHGAFENDGFRRAFLADVAARVGSPWQPRGEVSFAAVRERRLDVLGDLVAEHLDTDALLRLLADGPPAGLPFIPPGAPTGAAGPALAGGAPAPPVTAGLPEAGHLRSSVPDLGSRP
ncbi:cobyric acid synthase [Pseudofrankia inefficax]|uniref:Cobyric acid synthase n=1 Tax=Pseudofrankia inefficax (strain DSM 45817 / CECT 9037 / DDB 130130 / EuI1c) TaxID=298654 RepID=E3J9Z8_PSEI1|nr:cobyric acid synthase [Pseudofrankia inefficax]ADP78560.1 cobyric acid synthase CobQ [Pseudofrankia inefficax]